MYRGKLGHEPAAIKLLRTTQLSGSERERFLREAAILKSCRWVDFLFLISLLVS